MHNEGRVSRAAVAVIALLSALAYAFGLYAFTAKLLPDSGMAVVAFLFGAPFAACVLAGIVIGRRRDLSIGHHLAIGAVVVTVMLIAAGIVLREGSICLAMAAPLFYATGILGSLMIGALLRRRSRGTTAACTLALVLPLLALPAETQVVYPEETGMVSNSIDIDAPPETVWTNTTQLRGIRPDEHAVDFSHSVLGVPQPLDARLEGDGVGAVRHITWQKGLHFREVVTDWRPGQRLGWRFSFSPDSIPPGLERRINMDSDYLKLAGGEYRFEALPGGRTRLTLETRYWLKTPINGYCQLWAGLFLNDMHRAALRVIEARSEASRLAPRVAAR